MTEEKFITKLNGKDLILKINDWAEQTNGAVFLQYGETLVLSTAVMSNLPKEEMSFFPLTVEYEERFYAAGKIKGSRYIKRETRPSDEAICNARLIDRAIRPLFPENLNREVQVVTTVLSWDGKNDPDILGLLAASVALSLSDIPWNGPVGAVRVGRKEGNFILNPDYEERENNELDIIFAATEKDGLLINMIEGGLNELEDETILKAYQFAKPFLKELIDFQEKIAKKLGKEKAKIIIPTLDPELERKVKDFLKNKLEKSLAAKEGTENLREELNIFVEENFPGQSNKAQKILDKEIEKVIHQNTIKTKKRVDGRGLEEIRKIECLAGVLPRTHGSGLFCRGQTKTLSILTLGTPGDVQLLEGMEIVGKKRFMHHYNFPPYSTGEIKPMRGPGRREIGHGALVERALLPLIPSFEKFPYTIRIVSEILSSNGSTSMASVSSSSLALMDAGVPIKSPAAGIALGLVQNEKGEYEILTDIQGPEDHHGDMDFKAAGTKDGVTAIQMDVKINGITEEILKEALERGKKARNQILGKMAEVLKEPRPEISPLAPKILALQINTEKIREVIGPGGRVINEIIAETGVTSIDIEQDGKVFITAETEDAAEKAFNWVKNIVREVKVGEVFEGKVKRILDFGIFVEVLPGQEGLLHNSQLTPPRGAKVRDIINIGDTISVKVISIDNQGRINLSLDEKRKQ